jgi:membrane fusion protein, multidrug efflux system
LKRIVTILIVLAVVGAIAGPKVITRLRKPPEGKVAGKAEPGRTGDGGPGLRVSAIALTAVPLAETISATGSLRADEGIELQPETNGKIVSINFTEGARVKRGDLLLKLNDAELRAMLQRATYRLEIAQLKERRFAKLLETHNVVQQDYDAALNDFNVQQAEVALVEAQLAKMEIRAPFDGVIGLRFVSEGAFITPTTRIATLQRVDRLKVDFSVPEKYASRIHLGSPVVFTVDGGDRKYTGEIYALDPRIDSGTRTVLIRAVCPNPETRLLPGAFAGVEFTLGQVAEALLVPAGAVIPGLTEKNVFIVRDGKAVRRAVQTGMRTETSVQITEGLTAGDIVITSGIQQLRAGQAVSVSMAEGVAPVPKKPPEEKPSGGKAEAKKPTTAAIGR